MSDHSPAPAAGAHIRAAGPQDLAALAALEEAAFTHDRMSRRQFRYLLGRGHARTFIAELHGNPIGYIVVLFRRNSTRARVYSIAVAAAMRGRGLGKALLAAAESAAREADCHGLRLEVHSRNANAIALYCNCGYRQFAIIDGYYEDGGSALRFEKSLTGGRHASDPA